MSRQKKMSVKLSARMAIQIYGHFDHVDFAFKLSSFYSNIKIESSKFTLDINDFIEWRRFLFKKRKLQKRNGGIKKGFPIKIPVHVNSSFTLINHKCRSISSRIPGVSNSKLYTGRIEKAADQRKGSVGHIEETKIKRYCKLC